MHSILWSLIHAVQPLFVPICFISAWLLVGAVTWTAWAAIRDTVSTAKKLHEIPCANCQFFTNTHFLKCPVHPKSALSTDAIDCPDYQQAGYKFMK
ncbi:MAG: hypothetical protein HC827_07415 [Cyanobacteria bacterium RM1_2_2]|nr:hypothetical protein [Cyanobacteria bacterium RM1_2_2]